MPNYNLITIGNPKTLKGESKGYLTAVLHLAPASLSGFNVCKMATEGCKAGCLNTAGRGGMFKRGETTNAIQAARIRRTKMFFEDRDTFFTALLADIRKFVAYCTSAGLVPAIRLNGTSDLPWERIAVNDNRDTVMSLFPAVQFYDYTKVPGRHSLPANYHLTFSLAESNLDNAVRELEAGRNVAVVFRTKALPKTYLGVPVINGDETDLRFLDDSRVVVGLYAKGRAKKDTSGFVKDNN
jgi:hypothetical protein